MSKYKTCSHCRSRYRVPPPPRPKPPPPRPKPPPVDDMSREVFQATAWLHFWEEAGRPRTWRAAHYGFTPGDGIVAEDMPL